MMKKFEEYLKERIKLLQESRTYWSVKIADSTDGASCDVYDEFAIKVEGKLLEAKQTLNHFMQSVEVQSVADDEPQKERLIAFLRQQTKLSYVSIYENDFDFADKILKAINCD